MLVLLSEGVNQMPVSAMRAALIVLVEKAEAEKWMGVELSTFGAPDLAADELLEPSFAVGDVGKQPPHGRKIEQHPQLQDACPHAGAEADGVLFCQENGQISQQVQSHAGKHTASDSPVLDDEHQRRRGERCVHDAHHYSLANVAIEHVPWVFGYFR